MPLYDVFITYCVPLGIATPLLEKVSNCDLNLSDFQWQYLIIMCLFLL